MPNILQHTDLQRQVVEYNTVEMGTSTLYNIVFPPFKAAKDAGVKTVMNSFNEINGIPATASGFLQRDILKSAWDFDGFIVSDWDSIGELHEHGLAETDAARCITCFKCRVRYGYGIGLLCQ